MKSHKPTPLVLCSGKLKDFCFFGFFSPVWYYEYKHMVVQSLSRMYFLIKTLRNTETSAFKIH